MQNLTEVFDEMDLADAESGLAALLPGMIRLREVVDAYIVRIQRKLGAIQNGHAALVPKRGRPPKADKTQAGTPLRTAGKGSSWAALSPDERSREMKRRMAVANAKRTAAQQAEADAKRHESASRAAKARWANMSKAKQKARMAAMRAAKAAKPSARLVNGSAA